MKERPILFSGPMVRAILDGRKTQTRRVYKPKGRFPYEDGEITANPDEASSWVEWGPCPYGQPGDRLWVRETWAGRQQDPPPGNFAERVRVEYRAGGEKWFPKGEWKSPLLLGYDGEWRPSIHMPRWASRITLELTNVRVERLQDISEGDAVAEGCLYAGRGDDWKRRDAFSVLWDTINAKRPGCSWDDNPWVWVLEFRRVEP